MLLWALNPANPYGYYILLRWVCCGIFAYLAFKALDQGYQGWVWVLGITAAVYNPIFRVHLTREIWSVVNAVTIGIAVASVFAVKVKDEKRDPDPDPLLIPHQAATMDLQRSGDRDLRPWAVPLRRRTTRAFEETPAASGSQ